MPRKKHHTSDGAPHRWASQWLESLHHHELPRAEEEECITEEMPAVRPDDAPTASHVTP